MSKVTQKEAVYQAVHQVLAEASISVDDGQNVKDLMTKEHRSLVNQILFEGFRAGSIDLTEEKTDAELKAYVSGLQSNWLNKDKRLNGNMTYVAKNPGSRTGSTDPQVKALRALMNSKTDADEIAEIQSYIDSRLSTIGTKTAKAAVVDFSALPAELQAKYAPSEDETSEEA